MASSNSPSPSSSNSPLPSSPSSPSSNKEVQQSPNHPKTTVLHSPWVNHISKTFKNHLLIDTHLPVCIFQLPQPLTTQKPEAYVPQHIGLGPIHYFRTELYSKQQQLKLITAKRVLYRYKTSEFEKVVVEALKKLVPQARCYYDLFFDKVDDTLAWVFSLDGLFLLDVLSEGGSSESLGDVMMLENQIPLEMLLRLHGALMALPCYPDSSQSSNAVYARRDDIQNLLFKFCTTRSPLEYFMTLGDDVISMDMKSRSHLLDCMYYMIVFYEPFEIASQACAADIRREDVVLAVQTAGGLFPAANVVLQPVLVILNLPWDKITSLVKKMLGVNPTAQQIDIPSASKLSRIGKIKFCTTERIRGIEFDEGKLTFCLPVLHLKSDSEVILRNLVAYEELKFKEGGNFTEYVDLMCGIVDSVKDVKILREKNIIKGDLGDDEIIKLFNGISKSSVKTRSKSKLQKTIAKVNTHFGNVPTIKVYRFIKKLLLAPLKFLAIVIPLLSLVLMVIAGVCQVYDCKGHFGLSCSLPMPVLHANNVSDLDH